MRDHTRCRAHRASSSVGVRRDAEPGPRTVGAPGGNLNALKHGRYSNPLPELDLERLVVVATQEPDDLAYHIALLVRAIEDRIGDPSSEAGPPGSRSFRTLLVVNRALAKLVDRLASTLLRAEIAETLSVLPPGVRERVQAELEALTSRTSPARALSLLKKVRRERSQKKKRSSKTITGTGTRYTRNPLSYGLIAKERSIHSLSLVKHILL
jgi:hypothetical protein